MIRRLTLGLAVTMLLAGCASGTAATGPSATVSAPSPATSVPTKASPSPSAAALPTDLLGTWVGNEDDFDSGEIWKTTYLLQPCIQRLRPWRPTTDDEQCGEWTGSATVKGLPATCTATLSWLELDGATFVFQANGPAGSGKYRTLPHPYLEIDGTWYCWDTFRVRMTPTASGTLDVESIGAGSQSGAFVATAGNVARTEGS